MAHGDLSLGLEAAFYVEPMVAVSDGGIPRRQFVGMRHDHNHDDGIA